MSITLMEQETIILFTIEEDTAEIFTYEPAIKNKIKSLAKDFGDIKQISDNGAGGITYILPKNLVSIRRPRKISEDVRNAARESIKIARSSRKTV